MRFGASRIARVQKFIERQEYSKRYIPSNARILFGSTRVIDVRDQMDKSAWGTSWRRKALKGVVNCDKLRLSVKQDLTRRFPNSHKLNS